MEASSQEAEISSVYTSGEVGSACHQRLDTFTEYA